MDPKYHIVYIPGTLTVIGPLTLTFPGSPNGQVGTPYSAFANCGGRSWSLHVLNQRWHSACGSDTEHHHGRDHRHANYCGWWSRGQLNG